MRSCIRSKWMKRLVLFPAIAFVSINILILVHRYYIRVLSDVIMGQSMMDEQTQLLHQQLLAASLDEDDDDDVGHRLRDADPFTPHNKRIRKRKQTKKMLLSSLAAQLQAHAAAKGVKIQNLVKISPETTSKPKRSYVQILMWTNRSSAQYDGPETFMNGECRVMACTFTSNRSKINESEAVIFIADELTYTDLDPPNYRPPDQYWILSSFPSTHPPTDTMILARYNGLFNLTMTFRRDADLHIDMLKAVKLTPEERKKLPIVPNYASGRKRKVAWMASNCDTSSGRENYVAELAKHIRVDVFGLCGPYRCGGRFKWLGCREMLKRSYKFYLAFENNLCPDYISQIRQAFSAHVLPIVLGASDYSAVLPRDSYLDVRNFTSPRQLADYLALLNREDELYNRYFKWVKHFRLASDRELKHWCKLCEFLHKNDSKHVYRNMTSWYQNCLSPSEFYSGGIEN